MAGARFQTNKRYWSLTLKLDLHIVVGTFIPSPAEDKREETGKQFVGVR